ncbi:septum site-determining protein MinC [Citrobacter sp. JGM124]|uniref:septum site-determining protein MinC n=1 Tax=Citrobacter sp. JGM124 TaxID=2799789 RepID=UPI001BA951B9|nr:septum site-determining protein MinC [Citrobacter sp. JGM124]MBS0847124.1 septum site-determining protein MinC [Citrobacter sp. JGM124]
MSNTPIELKGSSFTLSVVHIHDSRPAVIQQALEEKIAQAPAFLKHAPVVLNVASLEGAVNWQQIQQAVLATGLHVVGISGCKDASLKEEIQRAGLPLLNEGKEKVARESHVITPDPIPEPAPAVPPYAKARFIDTPVRSGQRIYAQNSDLIVASHVSAGAELIADGNIHIYGMMRGRALAGAQGNTDTHIFCTHLYAELVSVAGEYRLSDEIPADYYGKAVRLNLINGALFFQPLF